MRKICHPRSFPRQGIRPRRLTRSPLFRQTRAISPNHTSTAIHLYSRPTHRQPSGEPKPSPDPHRGLAYLRLLCPRIQRTFPFHVSGSVPNSGLGVLNTLETLISAITGLSKRVDRIISGIGGLFVEGYSDWGQEGEAPNIWRRPDWTRVKPFVCYVT